MKVKALTKITSGVVASLAVVLLPVSTANAATQTDTPTINATIGETITLAVSGNVTIAAVPGGGVATGSHDATVSTNNTTGYRLNLSSNSTATTLAKGADVLGASAAPFGTPTVLGNDEWGYRIGSFAAGTYAGIVSNADTPATIRTTPTTASNEVTQVTWGVNVVSAKPSGTYSRQVLYTAITNN